jgi:hypothetical protein
MPEHEYRAGDQYRFYPVNPRPALSSRGCGFHQSPLRMVATSSARTRTFLPEMSSNS